MKNLKLCILVLFMIAYVTPTYAKEDSTTKNNNIQAELNHIIKLLEDQNTKNLGLQNQIIELKKENTSITQSLADNKNAFYESKLNTLNIFLGVFSAIFIILGIYGFSSISNIRKDNRQFIEDAKKDIQKGLNPKLKTAIKNTIKGSFAKDLEAAKADIADLINRIQPLEQKNNTQENSANTSSVDQTEDIFDDNNR